MPQQQAKTGERGKIGTTSSCVDHSSTRQGTSYSLPATRDGRGGRTRKSARLSPSTTHVVPTKNPVKRAGCHQKLACVPSKQIKVSCNESIPAKSEECSLVGQVLESDHLEIRLDKKVSDSANQFKLQDEISNDPSLQSIPTSPQYTRSRKTETAELLVRLPTSNTRTDPAVLSSSEQSQSPAKLVSEKNSLKSLKTSDNEAQSKRVSGTKCSLLTEKAVTPMEKELPIAQCEDNRNLKGKSNNEPSPATHGQKTRVKSSERIAAKSISQVDAAKSPKRSDFVKPTTKADTSKSSTRVTSTVLSAEAESVLSATKSTIVETDVAKPSTPKCNITKCTTRSHTAVFNAEADHGKTTTKADAPKEAKNDDIVKSNLTRIDDAEYTARTGAADLTLAEENSFKFASSKTDTVQSTERSDITNCPIRSKNRKSITIESDVKYITRAHTAKSTPTKAGIAKFTASETAKSITTGASTAKSCTAETGAVKAITTSSTLAQIHTAKSNTRVSTEKFTESKKNIITRDGTPRSATVENSDSRSTIKGACTTDSISGSEVMKCIPTEASCAKPITRSETAKSSTVDSNLTIPKQATDSVTSTKTDITEADSVKSIAAKAVIAKCFATDNDTTGDTIMCSKVDTMKTTIETDSVKFPQTRANAAKSATKETEIAKSSKVETETVSHNIKADVTKIFLVVDSGRHTRSKSKMEKSPTVSDNDITIPARKAEIRKSTSSKAGAEKSTTCVENIKVSRLKTDFTRPPTAKTDMSLTEIDNTEADSGESITAKPGITKCSSAEADFAKATTTKTDTQSTIKDDITKATADKDIVKSPHIRVNTAKSSTVDIKTTKSSTAEAETAKPTTRAEVAKSLLVVDSVRPRSKVEIAESTTILNDDIVKSSSSKAIIAKSTTAQKGTERSVIKGVGTAESSTVDIITKPTKPMFETTCSAKTKMEIAEVDSVKSIVATPDTAKCFAIDNISIVYNTTVRKADTIKTTVESDNVKSPQTRANAAKSTRVETDAESTIAVITKATTEKDIVKSPHIRVDTAKSSIVDTKTTKSSTDETEATKPTSRAEVAKSLLVVGAARPGSKVEMAKSSTIPNGDIVKSQMEKANTAKSSKAIIAKSTSTEKGTEKSIMKVVDNADSSTVEINITKPTKPKIETTKSAKTKMEIAEPDSVKSFVATADTAKGFATDDGTTVYATVFRKADIMKTIIETDCIKSTQTRAIAAKSTTVETEIARDSKVKTETSAEQAEITKSPSSRAVAEKLITHSDATNLSRVKTGFTKSTTPKTATYSASAKTDNTKSNPGKSVTVKSGSTKCSSSEKCFAKATPTRTDAQSTTKADLTKTTTATDNIRSPQIRADTAKLSTVDTKTTKSSAVEIEAAKPATRTEVTNSSSMVVVKHESKAEIIKSATITDDNIVKSVVERPHVKPSSSKVIIAKSTTAERDTEISVMKSVGIGEPTSVKTEIAKPTMSELEGTNSAKMKTDITETCSAESVKKSDTAKSTAEEIGFLKSTTAIADTIKSNTNDSDIGQFTTAITDLSVSITDELDLSESTTTVGHTADVSTVNNVVQSTEEEDGSVECTSTKIKFAKSTSNDTAKSFLIDTDVKDLASGADAEKSSTTESDNTRLSTGAVISKPFKAGVETDSTIEEAGTTKSSSTRADTAISDVTQSSTAAVNSTNSTTVNAGNEKLTGMDSDKSVSPTTETDETRDDVKVLSANSFINKSNIEKSSIAKDSVSESTKRADAVKSTRGADALKSMTGVDIAKSFLLAKDDLKILSKSDVVISFSTAEVDIAITSTNTDGVNSSNSKGENTKVDTKSITAANANTSECVSCIARDSTEVKVSGSNTGVTSVSATDVGETTVTTTNDELSSVTTADNKITSLTTGSTEMTSVATSGIGKTPTTWLSTGEKVFTTASTGETAVTTACNGKTMVTTANKEIAVAITSNGKTSTNISIGKLAVTTARNGNAIVSTTVTGKTIANTESTEKIHVTRASPGKSAKAASSLKPAVTKEKTGKKAITTAKIGETAVTTVRTGETAVTTGSTRKTVATTASTREVLATITSIKKTLATTASTIKAIATSASTGMTTVTTANTEKIPVTTASNGKTTVTTASTGKTTVTTASTRRTTVTTANTGKKTVTTAKAGKTGDATVNCETAKSVCKKANSRQELITPIDNESAANANTLTTTTAVDPLPKTDSEQLILVKSCSKVNSSITAPTVVKPKTAKASTGKSVYLSSEKNIISKVIPAPATRLNDSATFAVGTESTLVSGTVPDRSATSSTKVDTALINQMISDQLEERSDHWNLDKRPNDEPFFDHVVIVANALYRHHLEKLSCFQVTVITEDNLCFNDVPKVVRRFVNKRTRKALWLLPLGIYSHVEFHPNYDCERYGCLSQVTSLSYAGSKEPSEKDIVYRLSDMISQVKLLRKSVQQELGPKSLVMLVPLIPAAVVQEDAFQDHHALHSALSKNYTYSASSSVLCVLHTIYNRFCDYWSNMIIDPMENCLSSMMKEFMKMNQGKNFTCMHRDINYSFVFKPWIEMMKSVIKLALTDCPKGTYGDPRNVKDLTSPHRALSSTSAIPFNHPQQVIGSCLKQAEGQNQAAPLFQQIVIFGNRDIPIGLKELSKYFPIHFEYEKISFDEAGMNTILKYQKKWQYQTLWFILSDFSYVITPVEYVPKCAKFRCQKPLRVFNLQMCDDYPGYTSTKFKSKADNAIHLVKKFASSLTEHLEENSAVFVAPVSPSHVLWGDTSSLLSHKYLHKVVENDPSILVVIGKREDWEEFCIHLKNEWITMLKSTMSDHIEPMKFLNMYLKSESKILEFVNTVPRTCVSSAQEAWNEVVKGLLIYFANAKMEDWDTEESCQTYSDSAAEELSVASEFLSKRTDDDLAKQLAISPVKWPGGSLGERPAEPPAKPPEEPSATLPLVKELEVCEENVANRAQMETVINKKSGKSDVNSGQFAIKAKWKEKSDEVKSSDIILETIKGNIQRDIKELRKTVAGVAEQSSINKSKTIEHECAKRKCRGINMNMNENNVSNSEKEVKDISDSSSCGKDIYHERFDKSNSESRSVERDESRCDSRTITLKMISSDQENCHQENLRKEVQRCGSPELGRRNEEQSFINKNKTIEHKCAKSLCPGINRNKNENGVGNSEKEVKDNNDSSSCGKDVYCDRLDKSNSESRSVEKTENGCDFNRTITLEMINSHKVNYHQENLREKIQRCGSLKLVQRNEDICIIHDQQDYPKSCILVRVLNINMLPLSVIHKVFLACGALGNGKFDGEDLLFRFKSVKLASLCVAKLNNLRILDRFLKVKLEDDSYAEKYEYDYQDELAFDIEVEETLRQQEEAMVSCVRKWIETGVNINNFKIKLCIESKCDSPGLCLNYHTVTDRRRSPDIFKYSDEMCQKVPEGGRCPQKDACPYSHSTVERDFHVKRFRSLICPGWSKSHSCQKKEEVCPFLHPESSDSLYHDSWQDLYVEGLHNTTVFLVEAIRNVFKLPDVPGVRILVITPSNLVARLLSLAVCDLAKIFFQTVVTATHEDIALGHATVVIGTPSVLATILATELKEESCHFCNTMAVIIDDVTTILKDSMHHHQLSLVLKNILDKSGLNKVVVTEKLEDNEMGVASSFLRTKFVKVPLEKQKVKFCFSKIKESTVEKHVADIPDRPKNCSQSSEGSMRKSAHYSHNSHEKWNVLSLPLPSSERSLASKRKSHMQRRSVDSSSASSPFSPLFLEKSSKRRRTSSPDSSSSNSSLETITSLPGKRSCHNFDRETKKLFLADEKRLKMEHQVDYQTYLEVPEVHPEFEEKYETFRTKYQKMYAGEDKEECKKLWLSFWEELMSVEHKEVWESKRAKLFQQFEAISAKKKQSDNAKRKERKRENYQEGKHGYTVNPGPASGGSWKSSEEIIKSRKATCTEKREPMLDLPVRNFNCSRKSSELQEKQKMETMKVPQALTTNLHTDRYETYLHGDVCDSLRTSKDEPVIEDFLPVACSSQHKGDTRYVPSDRTPLVKEFLSHTLALLLKLCEPLGVLGPAIKVIAHKVLSLQTNTQSALKVLAEDDNALLLKMASEKCISLSEKAKGNYKDMLLKGSIQTAKLLEYATASSLIEKKTCTGLDVEKVAKATMNQDASCIVKFIKNALAYEGIVNPTFEDINEIFLAVSSRHFHMALQS